MENEKDTGIMKTFFQFLLWYAKCENDYVVIIQYLLEAGCDVASGGLHACALWYATDTPYHTKRREHNWDDELEKTHDLCFKGVSTRRNVGTVAGKATYISLKAGFLPSAFSIVL